MNPAFDSLDEEIKQLRLDAWHKSPGPRVGDFIHHPTGEFTRIAHIWPDRIQPTSGIGSFYFGHGYCSHSGGLEQGIARERFIDTGRTKPGDVWFFHHDCAFAHNGVSTTIPCRIYALQTQH